MKPKIVLQKQENAGDGQDDYLPVEGEALLRHLNDGSKMITGWNLSAIIVVANAHGWEVEITD